MTDEEIVGRVLEGESPLFELLMRRNNQRVYRAARAILRDDREAEDVMQDAYVRAFGHLREFDGRSRFSTWLVRIAVHEALARVRRAKKHESLDDSSSNVAARTEESQMRIIMASDQNNPERKAIDNEMRSVLERAIGDLPDDFRTVFMLRAVEEMSGPETAECLGIPEETVRTRLHRAKSKLQEMLLAEIEPAIKSTYAFEAPRCDRVVAAVFARLEISKEGTTP